MNASVSVVPVWYSIRKERNEEMTPEKLLKLVRRNNIAAVRKALKNGFEINLTDEDDRWKGGKIVKSLSVLFLSFLLVACSHFDGYAEHDTRPRYDITKLVY